jgi:hypothetical protein
MFCIAILLRTNFGKRTHISSKNNKYLTAVMWAVRYDPHQNLVQVGEYNSLGFAGTNGDFPLFITIIVDARSVSLKWMTCGRLAQGLDDIRRIFRPSWCVHKSKLTCNVIFISALSRYRYVVFKYQTF